MRIPFISIFLLALPFLEIAGFILVGRQIGVLATLGLVIGAAVAGAALLRIQGLGTMERVRREMDAGRDPSRQLANGAMMVVSAILLLIPGFVTDLLGLALLLPPVRHLAWRFLQKRIVVVSQGFSGFSSERRSRGQTIDLDIDEYSRDPDSDEDTRSTDSPWRRIEKD
ncbi:MAG: membrane protein FxsA [Rhizobiaceae bacterium]|nr:membrane protein FxsA [Rhizobiaceae bacterium]